MLYTGRHDEIAPILVSRARIANGRRGLSETCSPTVQPDAVPVGNVYPRHDTERQSLRAPLLSASSSGFQPKRFHTGTRGVASLTVTASLSVCGTT